MMYIYETMAQDVEDLTQRTMKLVSPMAVTCCICWSYGHLIFRLTNVANYANMVVSARHDPGRRLWTWVKVGLIFDSLTRPKMLNLVYVQIDNLNLR